jgi:hypothetical protein
VDCTIAVAFFGLGLLSLRIYYDIGAATPHNFRFATGVALTALLTLPLAVRRHIPLLPLVCVTLAMLGPGPLQGVSGRRQPAASGQQSVVFRPSSGWVIGDVARTLGREPPRWQKATPGCRRPRR